MLAVEHLTRTYTSGAHELTVLEDVSFEVAAGESLAIVGPSGSGKTTLLGLCAGLDRPSSGRVHLDGRRIDDQSQDDLARLRRELVGFVFQSFRLVSTLTALENVMVPLELAGASGAGSEAAAMLERVGLTDRSDHYPSQLSGGEQQRVALARAFANRPRILFADEPTGNLDAAAADHIVELLFELNADAGTTLVLVTHNSELAARTNRIIRLRDGRRVDDGLPDPPGNPTPARAEPA
jgi:putative ABC transport system ATP-binding protein